MPQIRVNEIDQSVYTRVVTDDKVRVMVPGIASFGPGIPEDANLTDLTGVTFTDVNEFEKVFGYTDPEYNPFKDDVSRIYAKQLINRGAAVTFVKVNTGTNAKYNVGGNIGSGTGEIDPEDRIIPASASHVDRPFTQLVDAPKDWEFTLSTAQPADWSTTYINYYKKADDKYNKETSASAPAWTANTFYYPSFTKYYTATFTVSSSKPADWDTTFNSYYTKDENDVYHLVGGNIAPEWKADTYYSVGDTLAPVTAPATNAVVPDFPNSTITTPYVDKNEDYVEEIHKFAPQIASIIARYDGSFGNRLLVTFSPVTSKNRSFTYQYSMVTVYRADVIVESAKDKDGNIKVLPRITGVHKLESNLVSLNPNDVSYFKNVEFNYITIVGTPTADDELSLIWSNINTSPESDVDVYSGFPEIPLRYIDDSGNTRYNEDALLFDGLDFQFNDEDLVDALRLGFGGFEVSTGTTGKTTVENVNRWIWACYNKSGVVTDILANIANCYENYTDPYVFDFDFVTAGGFIDEEYTITNTAGTVITSQDAAIDSTTVLIAKSDRDTVNIPTGIRPIHRGMLNLVNTRQDCIALFDINPYWEKNLLPTYVNMVNTSYGAFHAPWCYCNNPDAAGTILMPPSFVFLYTMLSNLINNIDSQKWFPPAGVTRATARVVVKPLYEIGSVLLDKWENNTLARVNPIMKLKNYGYVIFGQYTAYVAQDEYTHSALESLNVRLISNCVKKQIFNTCLKLTFEPNNSSLWMKFYDSMDKYLLFMKRNDGVYDYRIQMDEGTVTTDDINELRCPGKVWINPVRTAEFFDIDFILTEAGVTFTDTVEEGV
jgi:hypothetical protein